MGGYEMRAASRTPWQRHELFISLRFCAVPLFHVRMYALRPADSFRFHSIMGAFRFVQVLEAVVKACPPMFRCSFPCYYQVWDPQAAIK